MGRAGRIARRGFLIGSAAIAGGVAFGVWKLRRTPENPLRPGPGEAALNPYVLIDGDGVTIITPRAEMGQGVQTTLAALVAEEMDLSRESLRIMHGPSGAAYANRAVLDLSLPLAEYAEDGAFMRRVKPLLREVPKTLGLQLTGGSTSMPDAYDKMRLSGAAARHVLVAAAAARWSLPAQELKTEDGAVIAPDGRRARYGELAAEAAVITPPQDPPLKPRAEWRILGRSMPRLDAVAKATGTATFGIDTKLGGMLFASIRMNPRLGGAMNGFDASRAEAMEGVVKVVDLGNGVGVIARNTWLAMQALEEIEFDWGPPPYPPETEGIFARFTEALDKRGNMALRDDGDVAGAIEAADPADVIRAEYRVPYLAHSTMEPMNATALFTGDRLKIWAGNQAPVIARFKAAQAVGLSLEDVEIEVPFLGGGFGRRLEFDYVVLAAKMAQAMPGRPVKTTWSREEDMTHDTYRPGAVARFRGVAGDDGPVAIGADIAAPSVIGQMAGRILGFRPPMVLDRVMIEGVFDQPYGVPNYRVAGHTVDVDVPVGFWRSVGNSYGGFFHESFMDELAAAKGLDPLEMRLKLMKEEHPPSYEVLKKVAGMAGWTGRTGPGVGRGVAFTHSFGAPVAEIVEVRDSPGGIRITDVWAAADVGIALDPLNVRAQIMSGVIYGLSAAVMGEITFSGGAVEQRNFPDYDALRMNNAPAIEVAVLENQDRINGIGEPGTPPSMPALANALFDLTGKRARELPLNRMFDFA